MNDIFNVSASKTPADIGVIVNQYWFNSLHFYANCKASLQFKFFIYLIPLTDLFVFCWFFVIKSGKRNKIWFYGLFYISHKLGILTWVFRFCKSVFDHLLLL